MKLIYVLIIFLVFFNIFSFMTAWVGVFPYEYETDPEIYDVNITGDGGTPGDVVFSNLTGGMSWGNMFSLFFGDFSSLAGFVSTLAIMGAAIICAKWTHSPAPLVVGFMGAITKNMYISSMNIFDQFPINEFFMLAFGIGMIILFVVTCAEYLTHGDA